MMVSGSSPRRAGILDVARRLVFVGELVAQEVEAEHPELAPIDREWLVRRILDEIVREKPH